MPMTCLIVHSGGPTPVLNASLCAAMEACREARIPFLAARFGNEGLLSGDWVDLSGVTVEQSARLRLATGSVIGSSRRNGTQNSS